MLLRVESHYVSWGNQTAFSLFLHLLTRVVLYFERPELRDLHIISSGKTFAHHLDEGVDDLFCGGRTHNGSVF